jgi:MFS family permease
MGIKKRERKTGLAIGLLGWTNGTIEPNAGARGPAIQRNLNVSDGMLSAGWAGWPVGMLAATLFGGRLVERFGAKPLTTWGGVLYLLPFMFLGRASDIVTFAVLMLLIGLGNGLFDVGWARLATHHDKHRRDTEGESAGLVIQLLNGLFSLGSVVAALTGLVIVALDIPLSWHLAGVGAIGLAILFWARGHLPNPGATDDDVAADATKDVVAEGPRSRAPWRLRIVAFIGACALVPVGVGYLWSTIYLERLGASATLATTGLVGFTIAETIVRLSLGKLSQRFAALRDVVSLARIGAVVALVGLALIVVPQTIPTAVLGIALLAAGMAPIGPLVQQAGPEIWHQHKGRASALTSRYMYTALVAGPVIIGPLSSSLGSTDSVTPLRIALGCLVVLPLTVFGLARFLRTEPVAPVAPVAPVEA